MHDSCIKRLGNVLNNLRISTYTSIHIYMYTLVLFVSRGGYY